MKTHPVLFSAPMVRALLDGTKTQTRRVIKPRGGEEVDPEGIYNLHPGDIEIARCPYGQIGDLLWVRENFVIECTRDYHEMVSASPPLDRPYRTVENYDGEGSNYWRIPHYASTDGEPMICDDGERTRWKPSIHMPRWVSRLTLEITNIRVERLQSITVADAVAEGIERISHNTFRSYKSGGVITAPGKDAAAIASYFTLWESINGLESFNADPWVWVIEFTVHQKNVDALLSERGAA